MQMASLVNMPVYGLNKLEKKQFLTARLLELTQHHYQHCGEYKRLLHCIGETCMPKDAEHIPPVAARLFKEYQLKSIDEEEIFRLMRSSGTHGSQSSIYLDADSAKLQSQVLVKILQHWLGKARRPMLLIDAAQSVQNKNGMTARAAGLQGLSFFGRNHCYALNSDMQLDVARITEFFQRYEQENILIFGFTFIVWQQFIQQLEKLNLKFNLQNATLIHGGGWKKMQQQAVNDALFQQHIKNRLGDVAVHDYYGMVEQTGTIYMQCEHGYLHAPVWSDVMIRDTNDLHLLPFGEKGLIQVNSTLPTSYPGHCILTEDLGVVHGEDDCQCGRLGKYFTVHGRVPNAQVRGCSDTFS
ncbi:acyl-protein synthetase [Catenovulum sediminis]|uniref:Acyl-protein synthetase n=1 Tax=Catenovulum sediminis TaxID=1740262 RepID=A0ABV1RGU2_9ALTE